MGCNADQLRISWPIQPVCEHPWSPWGYGFFYAI